MKIVSDVSTNFNSGKFDCFCKRLGIQNIVSSNYQKLSEQWTAKQKHVYNFSKQPWKNAMKLILAYMSLLQIRLTSISPRLPSSATLLFNRPSRGLLPSLSRPPIVCDNYENIHTFRPGRQPWSNKEVETLVNILFSTYSITCSDVARRWGDHGYIEQ